MKETRYLFLGPGRSPPVEQKLEERNNVCDCSVVRGAD